MPLKVDLGLSGEDCQHAVTDECLPGDWLCFGNRCHWMFKTKVNMVQGAIAMHPSDLLSCMLDCPLLKYKCLGVKMKMKIPNVAITTFMNCWFEV